MQLNSWGMYPQIKSKIFTFNTKDNLKDILKENNTFIPFGNAVILAYITGMITAFLLTKLFVIEKSIHSTKKEFYYFTLVNIVAVIQTYIISVGFAKYLFPMVGFEFYPEAVAHAIGVVFPVFTSFIGHKYFSFRRANEKN